MKHSIFLPRDPNFVWGELFRSTYSDRVEWSLTGNITRENFDSCLSWDENSEYPKPTYDEMLPAFNEKMNSLVLRDLRIIRDSLIEKTDWRMTSDYQGSNQAEWAIYRQALRDLPSNYPNATLDTNTKTWSNVTFPTPPSND